MALHSNRIYFNVRWIWIVFFAINCYSYMSSSLVPIMSTFNLFATTILKKLHMKMILYLKYIPFVNISFQKCLRSLFSICIFQNYSQLDLEMIENQSFFFGNKTKISCLHEILELRDGIDIDVYWNFPLGMSKNTKIT